MELVGQIIKRKREIKNLTLKEISKELNVSEEILNDIENNNIKENTDIVFILGHLRSYCSYLGLNQYELLEKFKKENISQTKIKIDIERPTIEKNLLFSNKVFSFSLIVIVFLTFYLLFIENDKAVRDYAIISDLPENYISTVEKANLDISKKENIISKKENNNIKIIEDFVEIESKLSSSSAIAASSKIQSNSSVLITLKILEPTWLQLRDINNEIILSQLMNKNEEYSYNSDLNYSITSGNAGHIIVLINQKVRGKIGKKGQVVDSLVLDSNFNN